VDVPAAPPVISTAKLGFTEEGTLRDWLCVAASSAARDVQPAAHGMDDASVIEEQRSRPC
jgi:hypothetical protein